MSKNLAERFEAHQKFKTRCDINKTKFDTRMSSIEQLITPVSSMAKVTSIFKSKNGVKNTKVTPFECTSMTNAKVLKAAPELLQKYTKSSWLRTYPLATEMSSGNYDPAPMLAVGAQIIALNTQTKDYFAWMMYGYYCGGRNSSPGLRGYVLKPKHLRNAHAAENAIDSKIKFRLKIDII